MEGERDNRPIPYAVPPPTINNALAYKSPVSSVYGRARPTTTTATTTTTTTTATATTTTRDIVPSARAEPSPPRSRVHAPSTAEISTILPTRRPFGPVSRHERLPDATPDPALIPIAIMSYKKRARTTLPQTTLGFR
ncbi:hypothetical protein K0M31_020292 [Melipona bicolor]|uniref:Uncharacterized protein n=1 Tax=Melipona bicolor TaxID=60889 RepID=A0AA40KQN5_9HYME|nr:hypothetical protein K0M31_020292 [Melipona bicolor]